MPLDPDWIGCFAGTEARMHRTWMRMQETMVKGGDDADGKAGNQAESAGSLSDCGKLGSKKEIPTNKKATRSLFHHPKPIRRRVTMKVRSPLKLQVQSRLRAATAVTAKESANRTQREATWLSFIKELTSQVAGLLHYVAQQGEMLRSLGTGASTIGQKDVLLR